MDKYTRENLIIDPETQGLEDIIGKEVYANDVPLYCLKCANENLQVSILREIRKNDFFPFRVEDPDGRILGFDCIIVKKEEPKPEYVPFESRDEFIDAYDCANYSINDCVNYSIKNGTVENKLLNYGGIWLRSKITGSYCMVTEIWNNGVVLAGGQNITFWDELLENYVFFDGTPCGRLKENK